MIDNTKLQNANDTVYTYTTTAARKTVEFQTSLFKEWVAMNKKLVDLSPAKEWMNAAMAFNLFNK